MKDLDLVLSIQRDASIAALAHVFPPDRYPYPDETVRRIVLEELHDPGNILFVDRAGRGFALVIQDCLQRLFVREHAWGTGAARELHTAALEALRSKETSPASLWCLAENTRARRFYEKHGWHLDGRERFVTFPPHPLEVGYSIQL